jgi:hypothetical protein
MWVILLVVYTEHSVAVSLFALFVGPTLLLLLLLLLLYRTPPVVCAISVTYDVAGVYYSLNLLFVIR